MSRVSTREPVIVSSRAAQRLAAIYRQHRPDQPALAVVPQHGGGQAAYGQTAAPEDVSRIRAAVLDVPLSYPSDASASGPPTNSDWQHRRDIHAELYMTCHTLCRQQLLHGTMIEVGLFFDTLQSPVFATWQGSEGRACRSRQHRMPLGLFT